jgi:fructose-1,6-bisphosphatase/inositol monophosphatase family enzyme
MVPDAQKVIEIIHEAAATLIMPRFRQLNDDQVREKSPGDLVTIADVETEKFLEANLYPLISNSLVVGEENAEDSPEILERLKTDSPVWVIDPLDGTRNFAHQREPFTTIVAYCQGGETLMGWIHDPVANETVWAAKGQGCWSGNNRLMLPEPVAIEQMKGSLSSRIAKRLQLKSGAPHNINRVGCVGRDYMDLVLGRLDFARYAFHLKPWDHAAGVLIHTEAGGASRLLKADKPYHPDLTPKQAVADDEVLMLAPDEGSLDKLALLLKN